MKATEDFGLKRRGFLFGFIAFQVVFGFAIYELTKRAYQTTTAVSQTPPAAAQGEPITLPPSHPPIRQSSGDVNLETAEQYLQHTPALAGTNDKPAMPQESDEQRFEAISQTADAAFAARDYASAAQGYERMLALAPHNVDVYNNLGLSLHYLGRHAEAVKRLDEGIAVESTYARIWLTRGFVQMRTGDSTSARAALEQVRTLAPDTNVGREAEDMLDQLKR